MKITVTSHIDAHGGRPARFESDDDFLRVRVCHKGVQYELSVSNNGELQLRIIGVGFLLLKPRAANSVAVDAERS